jgi:hypothetical protein
MKMVVKPEPRIILVSKREIPQSGFDRIVAAYPNDVVLHVMNPEQAVTIMENPLGSVSESSED